MFNLYKKLNKKYEEILEKNQDLEELKDYYKEKYLKLEREKTEYNFRERIWDDDRMKLYNIISNLLIEKNNLNAKIIELKKKKKGGN